MSKSSTTYIIAGASPDIITTPPPIPIENLIAHYPFSDGSGNIVLETFLGRNLIFPGTEKPTWVTGGLNFNNKKRIQTGSFSGPSGDVTILGVAIHRSQGPPCYHYSLDSWTVYTQASSNQFTLSVPGGGSAIKNISLTTARFFAITQTGTTATFYLSTLGTVGVQAWGFNNISLSHTGYEKIYVGGNNSTNGLNQLTMYYFSVYSSCLDVVSLQSISDIIRPIVIARGVSVPN